MSADFTPICCAESQLIPIYSSGFASLILKDHCAFRKRPTSDLKTKHCQSSPYMNTLPCFFRTSRYCSGARSCQRSYKFLLNPAKYTISWQKVIRLTDWGLGQNQIFNHIEADSDTVLHIMLVIEHPSPSSVKHEERSLSLLVFLSHPEILHPELKLDTGVAYILGWVSEPQVES